jgi:hypothetical protein
MIISGEMLNALFDRLPIGCHVDLVLETKEVYDAMRACADLIARGPDKEVYCSLDSWWKLMDTWKLRRSSMTVRAFEEDGDDSDCACFRAATIKEAWKAEKDAVVERPVVFLA